jgi:hypothetical protein
MRRPWPELKNQAATNMHIVDGRHVTPNYSTITPRWIWYLDIRAFCFNVYTVYFHKVLVTNQPMHCLDKFIGLKRCSYMFRCVYISSSGSPCSLLSYFKILFKLICVKSLCIQCLQTLKLFWMQAVSGLVVKINCLTDVRALFKCQYILYVRRHMLPLGQSDNTIYFTTSQLNNCIINNCNVYKHWIHTF